MRRDGMRRKEGMRRKTERGWTEDEQKEGWMDDGAIEGMD